MLIQKQVNKYNFFGRLKELDDNGNAKDACNDKFMNIHKEV